MFGLGGEEIVFIVILALLIIGPEKLPEYARKIAEYAKAAKRFVNETKEKVGEELGPEFSEVDWQKLDPRQYDPRKIVRDALVEDTILDPEYDAKQAAKANGQELRAVPAANTSTMTAQQPATLGFDSYKPLEAGARAPFDTDAT